MNVEHESGNPWRKDTMQIPKPTMVVSEQKEIWGAGFGGTNGKPPLTMQYKDSFGVWHETRDLRGAPVNVDQWTEAKQRGSSHYKTGKVEPVDLYRSAKPHPDYNAFDIKALTDVIKYAFRLLTRGYLAADVDKIIHYMELYRADMEGR